MTEYPENSLPDEIAAEAGANPKKNPLTLIIKLLVTVLILVYISTKIRIADIHADFSEIHWSAFIVGVVLTIPNLLIQFQKWSYLVHRVNPAVTRREIAGSLLAGFSLGLITPGRLGETGKGVFITSGDTSKMIGMGFLDKLLSQTALAILGFAGLIYLSEFVFNWDPVAQGTLALSALILIVFLLIIVFRPEWIRSLIRQVKRGMYHWPMRDRIFALLSAADDFRRDHFMPSLSYALLFQYIVLLQIYFFINAFDNLSYGDAMAAAAAAMLIKSLLPVALMDIGVRESSMIFFLAPFGISATSAFNASAMIFLSNVLLPGIAGVYYLTKFNIARHVRKN